MDRRTILAGGVALALTQSHALMRGDVSGLVPPHYISTQIMPPIRGGITIVNELAHHPDALRISAILGHLLERTPATASLPFHDLGLQLRNAHTLATLDPIYAVIAGLPGARGHKLEQRVAWFHQPHVAERVEAAASASGLFVVPIGMARARAWPKRPALAFAHHDLAGRTDLHGLSGVSLGLGQDVLHAMGAISAGENAETTGGSKRIDLFDMSAFGHQPRTLVDERHSSMMAGLFPEPPVILLTARHSAWRVLPSEIQATLQDFAQIILRTELTRPNLRSNNVAARQHFSTLRPELATTLDRISRAIASDCLSRCPSTATLHHITSIERLNQVLI